jgi:hypothetical protein
MGARNYLNPFFGTVEDAQEALWGARLDFPGANGQCAKKKQSPTDQFQVL